jgi:hypothetical protein
MAGSKLSAEGAVLEGGKERARLSVFFPIQVGPTPNRD